MTTNNYANSTVTNNYSEVKKGYIHMDDISPFLIQSQAILSLMIGSSNDMDDEISNGIWAAHDLVHAALEVLRKSS